MTAAAAVLRRLRALPYAPLVALLQGRPTLVLAPHPDDESLGCGGLIAAACAAGLPPIVAILTDGAGSHPSSHAWPAPRLRGLREREARKAVAALGLPPRRLVFLRRPDAAAPQTGPGFTAAVAEIIALLTRHGCGSICAPWRHDPHCDHEAAHLIATRAARQARIPRFAYPVWGWTLAPDRDLPGRLPLGYRLDIARHLPAKRAAIAAHRSQHGAVITDAPDGFRLPPALLSHFTTPYEVFLGPQA